LGENYEQENRPDWLQLFVEKRQLLFDVSKLDALTNGK